HPRREQIRFAPRPVDAIFLRLVLRIVEVYVWHYGLAIPPLILKPTPRRGGSRSTTGFANPGAVSSRTPKPFRPASRRSWATWRESNPSSTNGTSRSLG